MGTAVILVYIAVIIVWIAAFKRNVGEAMIVGFVVMCLFAGSDAFSVFVFGLREAFNEPIVYSAMTFVFLGLIFTKTGLIDRQVEILNSVLGRVRGGAGYVSTIAAALFGAVSHGGSGNAAAVGSVTIPWMERSNWSKSLSATVVAGNAGLGTVIPPSPSLLLLVGSAAVAPVIGLEDIFLPCLAAAGWMVVYRLILVWFFVRKNKIAKVPAEDLLSFTRAVAQGWWSLLVFLGVAIPVLITVGPLSEVVERSIGGDAFDSINIVIWIPALMAVAAIALGFKYLPKSPVAWFKLFESSAPRFTAVGATVVFAFAASAAMTELGLSEQLTDTLASFSAAPIVTLLLVGLLIVLVAGPLPSAATIAAIGGVAFSLLTAAGIDPVIAATVILIFSSTEGASPPGAAPIYIASGIANVNPVRTFVPLVAFYVVPMFALGIAVGLGWLPITL